MATKLARPLTRSLEPLFRHDPFENLQREIADLIRQTGEPWDGESAQAMVPVSVDLSEADDSFRIQMDVPGVKPEDIDIEVTGNMVRIKGQHKEEKEEEGRTFHRVERRSGSFSRAFTLPSNVKEGEVKAECRDGVLTVTLPKMEVAKTQKIKVSAK